MLVSVMASFKSSSRGRTQRVYELEHRLDLVPAPAKPGVVEWDGAAVTVENVTTAIPAPLGSSAEPQVLSRNVSLCVNEGESLSVAGENGAGKTSLVRTLAGLWDPVSGTARIPPNAFFLPQESYFTKGTLAQQICYPHTREPDVASARALLDKVGLLDDLGDKLGEVRDWANVLSGGQKQRMGFARLLCHFERLPAGAPKFAFLDEPVSAVSKEGVVDLLRVAKRAGVTLITISHSEVVDNEHPRGVILKRGGEFETVVRE